MAGEVGTWAMNSMDWDDLCCIEFGCRRELTIDARLI